MFLSIGKQSDIQKSVLGRTVPACIQANDIANGQATGTWPVFYIVIEEQTVSLVAMRIHAAVCFSEQRVHMSDRTFLMRIADRHVNRKITDDRVIFINIYE